MNIRMLTAAAALALAGTGVHAGVILQPVAASSPTAAAFSSGAPANAVNQTGLSTGYTSLVTDFDSYIAASPTHESFHIANLWNLGPLTRPAVVELDLDLGGSYTIESLALWSRGSGHVGNVSAFDLLAADNASFTGAALLGSYNANPFAGTFTAAQAQVFAFAPATASFVRLRMQTNDQYSEILVGEVAFEVASPTAQTVPEPGTPALLLACGLALAGARRLQRPPGAT